MHISKTSAIENLSYVRSELQKNLEQIGSPRTPQASGLPGPGTSDRLSSLIDFYEVSGRNLRDGRSLLRTADGALGEIRRFI